MGLDAKLTLARARLKAAELRALAAAQDDAAAEHQRQARAAKYDGQAGICIRKASLAQALANISRAEADLVILEAEAAAEKEPDLCECSACDCENEATTTDDHGVKVCAACAVYMVDDGGTVVCSRQGLGRTCHVCGLVIQWGPILTGYPGQANYRVGHCTCGPAWLDEDRGDWGHYTYRKGGKGND